MTFDKLADRCLLFVDERKQMLIELLKEAELELSRRCNIYEKEKQHTLSGATSLISLTANYKQIIHIHHKGNKLVPMSEDEVYYNSDGTRDSGDPIGYFIRNSNLLFNSIPSDGKLVYSYYATVDNEQDEGADPSPIISKQYHRDLCDYAIAIAYAKSSPQLHDKYMADWERKIQLIINQDADRELIHTVKREV